MKSECFLQGKVSLDATIADVCSTISAAADADNTVPVLYAVLEEGIQRVRSGK
jgi:hypothetical protein